MFIVNLYDFAGECNAHRFRSPKYKHWIHPDLPAAEAAVTIAANHIPNETAPGEHQTPIHYVFFTCAGSTVESFFCLSFLNVALDWYSRPSAASQLIHIISLPLNLTPPHISHNPHTALPLILAYTRALCTLASAWRTYRTKMNLWQ